MKEGEGMGEDDIQGERSHEEKVKGRVEGYTTGGAEGDRCHTRTTAIENWYQYYHLTGCLSNSGAAFGRRTEKS